MLPPHCPRWGDLPRWLGVSWQPQYNSARMNNMGRHACIPSWMPPSPAAPCRPMCTGATAPLPTLGGPAAVAGGQLAAAVQQRAHEQHGLASCLPACCTFMVQQVWQVQHRRLCTALASTPRCLEPMRPRFSAARRFGWLELLLLHVFPACVPALSCTAPCPSFQLSRALAPALCCCADGRFGVPCSGVRRGAGSGAGSGQGRAHGQAGTHHMSRGLLRTGQVCVLVVEGAW